ncbi:KLTH0F03982p [Lachancea thermotolerans CBS 6340]|uniref:KLTH0F03982p n=1 Tax=Lachancea thermotolerans (strain ATCC 56472 / CBS 6340 / NRRL Y-8284) TaxID=559295 RepID=C5DKE3_LACTC|nr:KLTH0F03982p [Lachancea thermotolerans CBS 6340]CAR23944.1 KLTH0F03982p [Lachancea thermotolerans CBS 6340]
MRAGSLNLSAVISFMDTIGIAEASSSGDVDVVTRLLQTPISDLESAERELVTDGFTFANKDATVQDVLVLFQTDTPVNVEKGLVFFNLQGDVIGKTYLDTSQFPSNFITPFEEAQAQAIHMDGDDAYPDVNQKLLFEHGTALLKAIRQHTGLS